jgi:hypothetical protein
MAGENSGDWIPLTVLELCVTKAIG